MLVMSLACLRCVRVLAAPRLTRRLTVDVISMKQKYFAIRQGRKTGVFHGVWSQFEPYVKGFSGAKYKSFQNKSEAEEYMNDAPAASNAQQQGVGVSSEPCGISHGCIHTISDAMQR
jgi:hypothetical protein